MRDLLILAIVIPGCLAALRRPWIGVMIWTWLSLMNPHRYTFGIAYTAPLAAITVAATLLGLLFTKDKASPFKGTPVTILVLFMGWMTLTSILGFDPENNYEQWKKVMKIDFMIIIALALLHSKKQILTLAWVVTGSIAILGAKGGLFTLAHGGNYLVWGPPGSFIEDNNEFALALVITIPLLRFLQLQLTQRWAKLGISVIMLLCAASALGSHSRGALLAISAMGFSLWWFGGRKFGILVSIILACAVALNFLPQEWFTRMDTISEYQSDASAMGRINAWWMAFNLAKANFFGGGFEIYNIATFMTYAPVPTDIHVAHSIYFQVLGEHGFIGLILFLLIWWLVWREAGKLRKNENIQPENKWVADLGAMSQVCLIGYAVGGAFLSLAYFDLPYNVMVLVVLASHWLKRKALQEEIEQPTVSTDTVQVKLVTP
ncbi:MAG: putative O-glycosylation ligase, exosortase A system-associated [Betaproteobacteria bacterium HGW-Betaproteobacteria-10]|nr:MAG: putative O-glycosylation ligase, exosortase A system-associated [Betaproteobacteria bacterium HGW-Betaproteobacteria-10]